MKKIFFSLNIIHGLVSKKDRLLHPFSWTVTVSITFSHKNIKYCKINHKNTRLRLKVLINNFFINGFQILKKNKTMDFHTQRLKLWRFLLPFKVYYLNYLKFNSRKIRVVVKSLKCNNFLLNSIQKQSPDRQGKYCNYLALRAIKDFIFCL